MAEIYMGATRFLWDIQMQSAKRFKSPIEYHSNSLLNTKFDIQKDLRPGDGEYGETNVLVIGNKGHSMPKTMGDVLKFDNPEHKRMSSSLYGNIPLALFELGDDTPDARKDLCLRSQLEKDGKQYIAYWGKWIGTDTLPLVKLNGVDYSPDSDALNPTPAEIDVSGFNEVGNDRGAVQHLLDIGLSAKDVQRLINVCVILYGSEANALISEIGIVNSVKRNVTISNNGTEESMTEAIVARMAFGNTFGPWKLTEHRNGLPLVMDMGAGMAVNV